MLLLSSHHPTVSPSSLCFNTVTLWLWHTKLFPAYVCQPIYNIVAQCCRPVASRAHRHALSSATLAFTASHFLCSPFMRQHQRLFIKLSGKITGGFFWLSAYWTKPKRSMTLYRRKLVSSQGSTVASFPWNRNKMEKPWIRKGTEMWTKMLRVQWSIHQPPTNFSLNPFSSFFQSCWNTYPKTTSWRR